MKNYLKFATNSLRKCIARSNDKHATTFCFFCGKIGLFFDKQDNKFVCDCGVSYDKKGVEYIYLPPFIEKLNKELNTIGFNICVERNKE